MMDEVQEQTESSNGGSPFELLSGKMENVVLDQASSATSSDADASTPTPTPAASPAESRTGSQVTEASSGELVSSASLTADTGAPSPSSSSLPRFTSASPAQANPYSVRSSYNTPRASRPRYTLPSNPAYASLRLPTPGSSNVSASPALGVGAGGGSVSVLTPASTSLPSPYMPPVPAAGAAAESATTLAGTPQPPLPYGSAMASPLASPHSVQLSMDAGGGGLQHGGDAGVGQAGGVDGGMSKWIGWMKGAVGGDMINKVVEKAKNAGYTTLTTLDPQMKQYLRSGGAVEVIIGSDQDQLTTAIREAFQFQFGRATCRGVGVRPSTSVARQLVGFPSVVKACEGVLESLQASGQGSAGQVLVSVEGGLVELTTDRWYEVSCLSLHDQQHCISLQTYSQPIPVPTEYIVQAQQATPDTYPLRASGLAVSIGELVNKAFPSVSPLDWLQHFTGVSKYETVFNAAKSLAGLYDYYIRQRQQQQQQQQQQMQQQ